MENAPEGFWRAQWLQWMQQMNYCKAVVIDTKAKAPVTITGYAEIEQVCGKDKCGV